MDDAGHPTLFGKRDFYPKAIYFEDADVVEYVRRDTPCVHRRIDGLLTLILDFDTRCALGFQLKGFKHHYLRTIKPAHPNVHFAYLVQVIQFASTLAGNEVFQDSARAGGYEAALQLADEDKVELPRFSASY